MNWLIYIGGFFLWDMLWARVLKVDSHVHTLNVCIISIGTICSWIWFCIKFIK